MIIILNYVSWNMFFFILKKLFILYKQSINGKYLKWEIND